MSTWQEFEKSVFKYLRRHFSDNGEIHFIKAGDSDSTSLDIRVIGKSKKELHIEVKSHTSQAGQFVAQLNQGKFSFRPNKKFKSPTLHQQDLIDHLNKNSTKCVTQASIPIKDYPERKIIELVKEHYQSKGANYFISGEISSERTFLGIIPVAEIGRAFNFFANIRRKKSGTRELPKSFEDKVQADLKRHLDSLSITLISSKRCGRKYIILTNNNKILRKKILYFTCQDTGLYLSQNKNNLSLFELKTLSSTNNITIIYSLVYNWLRKEEWLTSFKKDLKEL